MIYVWVALGGALGSVARFSIASVLAERLAHPFPWLTLLVNVSGSFVIGLLASLGAHGVAALDTANARAFLMVGILGGYTTFSSFSLQTLELARSGAWAWAGIYVLGSVAFCLVGVWLGYLLGGVFAGR
ncbi:MAG TPA: fluoride efflux transporter CrcB [Chthoniobacterales bacterium]|nr:fluoride efflux transporter CrcB [Chthoniobacterales bacterium]